MEFTGQSTRREPHLAVAEGLSQAVNALVAAGGAPLHLTTMTWTVADPGAFHPARHVIDMACREVMGGMRPPITILQGADQNFVCRAQATIPQMLNMFVVTESTVSLPIRRCLLSRKTDVELNPAISALSPATGISHVSCVSP